jgi:hypothetical protein
LLPDLSELIASDEFAQRARSRDSPYAFTRCRKLPLPALVTALLSMRCTSQQVMLDGFFASLYSSPCLVREVSDRAFAQARARLHAPALSWLNDYVVQRAEKSAMVPRWCGLRLVAADASVLMPAVRACHRTRSAAHANQRLFMLYLPGAELTLHASVHDAETGERAMLMQALDRLAPDDVLLLDRGYVAAWLVQLLNERGIRFIMRCDIHSGWPQVQEFLRSGADEALVQLKKISVAHALQWGCLRGAPSVRLVRQIAPNGQQRVLATNLDASVACAQAFGDLYHQRWRIEEAFKRLKHRLHLEAVSGLTQQALLVDVAAKVLADNLMSLMCSAASAEYDLPSQSLKCNRSYAAQLMPRFMPCILLAVGDVIDMILQAIVLLGSTTQKFIPRRSGKRPKYHMKPHPHMAYKG